MKKTIRRFITLTFIVFVIMQVPLMAFAAPSIPEATSDFYVNDFAAVFSEEEKQALMDRAVELSDATDGIQVVITTVESLDGNTVEDYANAMYNQYEIGRNDMGLLILLSTGDRKIRVEVGKSMEAYFNDAKAGRFIDNYAIPKLKENKFNEGLISLQTEVINEIGVSINNVNTPTEAMQPEEENPVSKPIVINWGAIVLIAAGIVIIGIFVFVVIISYKKTKKIQELEQKMAKLVDDNEKAKIEAERRVKLAKSYNDDLYSQLEKLKTDKSALTQSLNALKDRYDRVNALYPTADEDVTRMIENEIREHDMEEAAKADDIVNKVLQLTADRSIIPKIQQAQRAYNALSYHQRQYAKADVNKLNDLYKQSMKLQYQFLASEATSKMTRIIAGITVGKEVDIDKLSRAKSAYDNLEYAAKQYVDKSILDKVSMLLSQAQRDKKRREEQEEAERKRKEEEERRKKRQQEEEERRRNSNNHNGFGGGSSGGFGGFGGFGGHSGGGGASRGF